MSKIEEALQKARAMQASEQAPRAEPEPESEWESTQAGPTPEPAAVSTSREIAPMDEIDALTPPELASRRIIYSGMRDVRALNAFRHLRTTLLQQSSDKGAVVLVTTTAARGGASFVARNLGAAITLDSAKTAMAVDCHLRRPAFGDLIDSESLPGLTDYLTDSKLGIARVIHSTGIPRFRVLPAGTRSDDPEEFLTPERMGRVVSEIRRRFRDRYVILDAPSMERSADVRMLSELADFALVVVPYATSSPDDIEHAVNTVGEERLLGTVFNDEPSGFAFD